MAGGAYNRCREKKREGRRLKETKEGVGGGFN